MVRLLSRDLTCSVIAQPPRDLTCSVIAHAIQHLPPRDLTCLVIVRPLLHTLHARALHAHSMEPPRDLTCYTQGATPSVTHIPCSHVLIYSWSRDLTCSVIAHGHVRGSHCSALSPMQPTLIASITYTHTLSSDFQRFIQSHAQLQPPHTTAARGTDNAHCYCVPVVVKKFNTGPAHWQAVITAGKQI